MYAYTGHNGKKRRQVVPCDYWIRGGCPRSAAKCDFAHSFPNQVRPGYCRYYAMGRCVHGMRCKFKHELPEDPQLPAQWNSPPPSAHPAMIYPATPPSAPSVMPLMTPPQMASPLYMMTPPQMMTPASSISSMSSLTYSPSTATTASDDMPWWNDEPEQCDDVSVAVAAVDEFGVRMPTTQPVPAVTKPRRTKYKTNPCVFFLSTSGCSRGDSCTFLHGGEVAQVPSPELPVHALPAKPSSAPKQESQEDRKREYYPVTWRVISGGTRLGRTTPPSERPPRPRKGSTRQRLRPRLPSTLALRPSPPPFSPPVCLPPRPPPLGPPLLPAWTAPTPSPAVRTPEWIESPLPVETQEDDIFSIPVDYPPPTAYSDDGVPPNTVAFPTEEERSQTPPLPRRLSLPETPGRARAMSSPYAVSPRVTRRRVERLHLFPAESP